MNAAFFALLEEKKDLLEEPGDASDKGEKFRMARRPQVDQRRTRPKQHNGIHRRRRKKIRL